ncbi:MAG: MBL fold metallo-hydrolase [Candidatus Thorarchaeota archaeon]
MNFYKAGDHLYLFINDSYYKVVAGAMELPNKLIMIDTGTHIKRIREFREYVENETKKKFEILFLTHYHLDHTWGNQVFADCRIIATKSLLNKMLEMKKTWTEKKIAEYIAKLDDPESTRGLVITPPNEIASYLEIADNGVKVIFKQTGGHSDDSAYVYCPKYKILFAGDNLFRDMYPYGQDKTSNPDLMVKAYKEYLTLDVERFIPGHQDSCEKQTIKKYIHFIEQLKTEMVTLHHKGEAKEKIFEHCLSINPFHESEFEEPLQVLKNATLDRFYDFWINGKK